MGWQTSSQAIRTFFEHWPAEFIIKFTLGMYRQYDHLKILYVGLKPGSRVSIQNGTWSNDEVIISNYVNGIR